MRAVFLTVAIIVTVLDMKNAKSSSVNKTKAQSSPAGQCNKPPVNNCNCHCSVTQNSHLTDAVKALERKLENLIALVNKTSTPLPQPAQSSGAPISSCQEQYERDNLLSQGNYGNFGCGDGGWTLVMKTDGAKRTFHYNSNLWGNRNAHNLAGGQNGFDNQEKKLPTYWNTPFSKICLGVRIGFQINFTVINRQARSLSSLIADGSYRATSLSRTTWKGLIGSAASLQNNCNREFFNVACSSGRHSKVRIGIVGNNLNDCTTCDSRIGFGGAGIPDDSNTYSNVAEIKSDNGDKFIKGMGYIFVK